MWQRFFLIFSGHKFFADCLDWQVANDFLIFSEQKFFADCLYWLVAKDSLPTALFGRWQSCHGS
jgi:hypothetical protein